MNQQSQTGEKKKKGKTTFIFQLLQNTSQHSQQSQTHIPEK